MLTGSTMAKARLRANRKQYRNLAAGIFLSVFLVSTLIMSLYGMYRAELNKRYLKVGYLDMVVLDKSEITEEQLREMDLFERFGHAYISGVVTGRNVYVGSYDQEGLTLMNLEPLEGRLPEAVGEIAVERSAMDILDAEWKLGERVWLSVETLEGREAAESYTVVGFLPERNVYLEEGRLEGVSQFPTIVTSFQEPDSGTAVHCLLTFRQGTRIREALEALWEYDPYGYFYALTVSGERDRFPGVGNLMDADKDLMDRVSMAVLLAAALVLSCGVGISTAMEGLLSRRREEIGILRAMGATKRQIRRLFGRESWILALVLSPLSLGMGCLGVWGLSRWMPENLEFNLNLWLLAPIGIFSVAVILLWGYVPLVRASRQMPVDVIRDTKMPRKGMVSRKEFVPSRLMASRQARLHPSRQIGAVLLVTLMLLCAGIMVMSMGRGDIRGTAEPEFTVRSSGAGFGYSDHACYYSGASMSRESIEKLGELPHVESLEIYRSVAVTMLLPQVPRYVVCSYTGPTQYGCMDDSMFQEYLSFHGYLKDETWEKAWREAREDYFGFLEEYRILGEAYDTHIVTMSEKKLEMLGEILGSGVDMEAINAGKEVLVFAPDVWTKISEDGKGSTTWYSETAMRRSLDAEDAQKIAWNDTFTAGQRIPLLQLYRTEADGVVYREDAEVTIGAVVPIVDYRIFELSISPGYLITTEEGLAGMGLYATGPVEIGVRLDGSLPPEEEETLERQITAVARGAGGYNVYSFQKVLRELAEQDRRQSLLFGCMMVALFASAVGLMVSSVNRKLNQEGRTIGMLRAVGADESCIFSCYSGQIRLEIGWGLGISLALPVITLGISMVDLYVRGYSMMPTQTEMRMFVRVALAILIMAAACWLLCRYCIRQRVREIMGRSVIENIREL